MAKPPAWAIDLVQQIAIEQGLHKPELTWRRSSRAPFSSGSTDLDGRRIVVTAGSDRSDQRTTLIHEMAHIAAGPGEWHSARFYEIAWRFYGLYAPNVPVRTLLKREGEYKLTALLVAQRLGLHGAKAAIARRAAMRRPK